MISAPAGGEVTESRWDIQTVCSEGSPLRSAPRSRLERGLTELRGSGRLDRPAEVARHQLHAVTDAEHRHAELEDARVDLRCTVGVDGGRPAGEHERRRVARAELRGADPVGDDLRVDPRLTDTARDQLRVLAAEIEDEDGTLGLLGMRARPLLPDRHVLLPHRRSRSRRAQLRR